MKKLISRLEKRRNTSSTSKACYERLENRQMLAGDSFWVYYGEGNKVFRSLNDGTQKQELMALTIQPGPVNAAGIMVELDRVNNKIYAIANQGHNPIHLYRSNLDGSNLELLNNSDSMGTILQGIAVNEQTGAVYVSPHSLVVRTPGSAPGGMLRITNNGQTVTPFSQKPWYVTDMEVDAANGHVYYAVWPSYGGGVPAGWAGIRRMNLDGSNDIGIFQTGGNGSFALDTANNRIWFASTYSSSLQNDRIYTINLTGGNFQEKSTVAGYTFGDIDLSESKDGIVFLSSPKTGNPNPNARIQQLAFTSTTAVPLFDTPNISAGIELLAYNRPPTLDSLGDLTINEDAPQQTVNLSGITAGSSENQPLRITALSSNTALIPHPSVNYNSPNSTGLIEFSSASSVSGTGIVTVTVEDGGPDGDLNTPADNLTFSRSFQVTVNPVNDAPTWTYLGGDITYRENVIIARLCNAVRLQDIDTSVFTNGTLRVAIESGGEAADRLWLMNSQYLTVNGNQLVFNGLVVGTFTGGTGGQPLQLSFNNRASTNRVQHVLRCVCFAHDSDNPQAAQRTVSIQLTDGSGGQVTASKRVNVIPVNDRPVLSGIPASSTHMLNASPIFFAPGAIVTDQDNANFSGGQLSIRYLGGVDQANRLLAGDSFSFDAANNLLRNGTIVGQRNASGGIGETNLLVTFNPNATRAIVQEFLRSISFQTIGGTSKATRYLEILLTDGLGGTSNLVQTRIDVV